MLVSYETIFLSHLLADFCVKASPTASPTNSPTLPMYASPFNLPTPEGDDTSFDVKGSNFGTSDFRIEMDLTGMGRSISEGGRDYGVSVCIKAGANIAPIVRLFADQSPISYLSAG